MTRSWQGWTRSFSRSIGPSPVGPNADSVALNEPLPRIMLKSKELFDAGKSHGTADKPIKPKSATEFILKYATINVVGRSAFTHRWLHYVDRTSTFEENIRLYFACGHSRDEPTPMVHTCRKMAGCPYSSIRVDDVRIHKRTCTTESVTKAKAPAQTLSTFSCSVDSCNNVCQTCKVLLDH